MTRAVTAAELNRCVLGRQLLAERSTAALSAILVESAADARGALFDDTRGRQQ